MRFYDGYWMTRPEYQITYAHEFYRSEPGENGVSVIAATKPVRQRGDVLGSPTIQVDISAPMDDVLCVEISHFLGEMTKRPELPIYTEPGDCMTGEDEHALYVSSGKLQAVVHKEPSSWEVDFCADGRLLTRSAGKAMAHIKNQQKQTNFMSESLELNIGTYVYGLGERFGPYLKNGQSVEMWNADGGTGSEQAYKSIPFYMTNQKYGVFVADSSDVNFEIATERVEQVQISVQGERLKYYIIYGETPKQILERFTALTGRPALPPAWTFGLWLTTSFITNYDENTVAGFLDGMAERDIPLSVFHFDCFWMRVLQWCDFEWDRDSFPDPQDMLKRYHDRGLKICVWINPYIGQRSPLFAEGVKKGYFIRKTNGDIWQTDKWQPGMAIVDFTNAEAAKWYEDHLKSLLDMGVDCFKTDFGERLPVTGVVYCDGSSPLHMHNHYTSLYNETVFRLLERKRGQNNAALFARNATIGGQRFPIHWGGDNSSTYLSMLDTLRGGLSLAHCGFGFWSHDISGFEKTATADLYKRWCAFGMLSSHSRLHGSSSYRVPWLFDEEACDVLRFFVKLKCRLMPYLYAKAVEAHQHGIPMLRPMMLEFPEDPSCEVLDRQYMLGDSLLVAPVFNKEGLVSFYLPEGTWISLIDGKSVTGGRWQSQTHSFMSLPLYARQNSIIIMGATDNRPDYDYAKDPEVHLYGTDRDGECKLYDSAGQHCATFYVHMKKDSIAVTCEEISSFTVVLHQKNGDTINASAQGGTAYLMY